MTQDEVQVDGFVPQRVEPGDVWYAWKQLEPDSWQSMVSGIVHQAIQQCPEYSMAYHRFIALVDLPKTPPALGEIQDAENDLRFMTVELATALGWALCQTWTGNLEEIASWGQRAIEQSRITVVPMVRGRLVVDEGSES